LDFFGINVKDTSLTHQGVQKDLSVDQM